MGRGRGGNGTGRKVLRGLRDSSSFVFSEPLFVEVHDMCAYIVRSFGNNGPSQKTTAGPKPIDFPSCAKIISAAGVKDRLNMAADKEEEFSRLDDHAM